ncbi:MAG TPA: hypothetical protein VHM70_31615 [Polyangiaceae bacterium]|jgi:hypothetical protein|nr:hypothetical protein [Polyangiaceae bacterium]
MWAAILEWFGKRKGNRVCSESVAIDDTGVRRVLADGSVEAVQWDELESVEIVTTDAGPFQQDVFWVLAAGDHGCIVSGEFGGRILDHASRFAGWDHEAVIRAMGSTDHARFAVWDRARSGLRGI